MFNEHFLDFETLRNVYKFKIQKKILSHFNYKRRKKYKNYYKLTAFENIKTTWCFRKKKFILRIIIKYLFIKTDKLTLLVFFVFELPLL